ncbi:MAG: glycosyltransferase [Xanthomonadales bacterium]|nr:glycosyltransferase [Xanthomonadales bacterium]
MQKHCVIVLGMHRSGTSSITRAILDLGFDLLSETLPSHPTDNPNGYWESKDLVHANNRILTRAQSHWKDINPLPNTDSISQAVVEYQSEIDRLIQSALGRSNQIVIKDPRICRLLPFMLPIINKRFDNLAVITIIRQAEPVFNSLNMRSKDPTTTDGSIIDRNHAYALWLRYNLDAEINSQGLNRLKINHKDWCNQPTIISETIQKYLASIFSSVDFSKNSRLKLKVFSKKNMVSNKAPIKCNQDTLRLVDLAYQLLLKNDSFSSTLSICSAAAISIPDLAQTTFDKPPVSMTSRLLLKHISGRVPGFSANTLKKYRKNTAIVYISNMVTTPCHIYRVKNPVDSLNRDRHSAVWMTSKIALANTELLINSKLVIIHRSQWTEEIQQIINFCKTNKIRVAFDIDDIIFEPSYIEKGYLASIKALPVAMQNLREVKITEFRKTLLATDFCITSTPAIERHIHNMGKAAICIPNGFSAENLLVSEHWREQRKMICGANRIGYASGSNTHAADFDQVAVPLAKFLCQNPDWTLTIVGKLDLSPYSTLFNTNQVELRNKVAHVNLAYELARFDINIIPLEFNPFCDAKSPLKFYEAALCGVPTIATKNELYTHLFENEKNGLLAKTPEDWIIKLTRLAKESILRELLAANARKYCTALFSAKRQSKQLLSLIDG